MLTDGLVYQGGQLHRLDILVQDGRISALGENLDKLSPAGVKKYDASRKLVSPGLVDVHVHYRDPGFTYKETVKTGAQAAAHGGFTTVCAMPNVDPVPDTPERLQKMIKKNHEDGCVHIKQYAATTQDRTSDKVNDLSGLKRAGAFAFSNDGNGIQNAETMYQAMKAAAALKMPIVEHIEDDSLKKNGVMNAGRYAVELGLPGMPGLSESSQLARDLLLAQETGVHYHACHLSTRESVALVRLAKEHHINVTCEVTPHHLLLADQDIPADDGFYKMNPPLRSTADCAALFEGLLDGTIDMIATDHAPHAASEKMGGMCHASFGITGSETAFALLYTRFVKTQRMSLEQLLDLMSIKPAKCFGMNDAGALFPGKPADLAVFDLEHEYVLQEERYFSLGKNTPFTGTKVYGQTCMTFVAGELVYKKED